MAGRSKVLAWGLPIVGVGTLLAGAYMVAANRPHRPAEQPPRSPTSAPNTAGLSDAASYIGAIGTTEPPGEAVQIGAHVPGIVDAVRVSVGDAVEAGQALFAIEGSRAAREVALRERGADVARAQVEALRSQIPTARAELLAARSGIASAEARVGSARAALSSAETDLANRENLLRIAESVDDARAISGEEIDSRRFAADGARARVAEARAQVAEADARVSEARASEAIAEAKLSLLVDASTGEDGPDLRVTLDRAAEADAAVELARDQLALLTVRSPISGRVLQVNIRAGEFAPAKELTDGLVVIGRPGRVHIRAQIDEVDIARLDRGALAWASPRGDAERRMEARLEYIEPLVVPKRRLSGRTDELVDTRVLEVVYSVEAGEEGLYFGQQMDLYIEAAPLGAEGGGLGRDSSLGDE